MTELGSARERAIEFEKSGVEMYLKNADKTANPLARNLFYSLAIEEIEHIMFIEKQIDPSEGLAIGEDNVQQKMKLVFNSLEEEDIEQDSDNVAVLELAMKLEEKGKSLYIDLRDGAESEEEKKYFTTLIKEEERHLEALKNVHSYLTKTSDWFHGDERSTWNWMNI